MPNEDSDCERQGNSRNEDEKTAPHVELNGVVAGKKLKGGFGRERRQKGRDERTNAGQDRGEREVGARHAHKNRNHGSERRRGKQDDRDGGMVLHFEETHRGDSQCGYENKIENQNEEEPTALERSLDFAVGKSQTDRA